MFVPQITPFFFACNEQVKDCISVWRALFTKHTPVWLVIFMGTNFREIGQNFDFRNFFAVLIFTISESGTRSNCFHYQPCAAVWIVHLCLRSILDYFSDSRHMDVHRSTQTHADERRKTQTNTDKRRQTQTNADKRRRTQGKLRPVCGRTQLQDALDVRRLFKDFRDFWDVLY